MEITMEHRVAARYVDIFGGEALLGALGRRCERVGGRDLQLYSLSADWYRVGPEFIAKAKGVRGDVIVRWSRCQADWGNATESQRCVLEAGHAAAHVDGQARTF